MGRFGTIIIAAGIAGIVTQAACLTLAGNPITDSQQAERIRKIYSNEITPTPSDYRLLRQDINRALAAYPEVPSDKLLHTHTIQADVESRVPCSMNTSGNSYGEQIGTACYLDGPETEWFVRDEFPKRATAQQTKAFLAEKKASQDIENKMHSQIAWVHSSPTYALEVECLKSVCTVTESPQEMNNSLVYTFPFIPSEWTQYPITMDQIRSLPSFGKSSRKEVAGNNKVEISNSLDADDHGQAF
ncbi:hypothetical protein WSS15_27970 [Acetobacter pasteurianus]|uniref:Uncharacterized protein n=1 Tax=Acetobacter pasteurianus NBRC 3278 TaxID=1226660 RepID=A0A401X8B7_ACEPA|nr:hypothetical protein [Acetobacter pasteurianus]GCD64155.1 hypothetical protein NBRC3278_3248 [Acetobacter pasteurianus NBRC 3278]GCD70557.1 hypothetical protein NBRC3280_3192 [Acetobacter pasteurianus NBRC 3280]GLH30147.1 hypothetical protein WSS15_27970 [Acetobacter pasteurianus]